MWPICKANIFARKAIGRTNKAKYALMVLVSHACDLANNNWVYLVLLWYFLFYTIYFVVIHIYIVIVLPEMEKASWKAQIQIWPQKISTKNA